MKINIPALLACRAHVPDRTLLDCLEIAETLDPWLRVGMSPSLTTADLISHWHCDQSTASRRMTALLQHQLIDARLRAGPGAYWTVSRVGPVA